MNEIKISVIISIYNGEKDIPVLLESLEKQSIQEIEYILIDNGSRDRTQEICRAYAEKDKRFRVEVIPDNVGYIRARNYGLSLCKGEYITFADADDRLVEDTYMKMYTAAEESNADWLIASYYQENESGKIEKKNLHIPDGVYTGERLKTDILPVVFGCDEKGTHINGFMWRMLFRRMIIENINNRFIEDVKPLEDELFNQRTVCAINTVTVLDMPVYYYKVNEQSVTAQALKHYDFEGECKKSKLFFEYTLKNMQENNVDIFVKNAVYRRVYDLLYMICLNAAKNIAKRDLRHKADFLKAYFPIEIARKASENKDKKSLSFYNKIVYNCLKKGNYLRLMKRIRLALKFRR